MAVDIDEPGSDEQALGVDYIRTPGVGLADLANHAVRNGHIRLYRFVSRAVEYGSVADDEIESHSLLPLSYSLPPARRWAAVASLSTVMVAGTMTTP